jgi:hypothetical protein
MNTCIKIIAAESAPDWIASGFVRAIAAGFSPNETFVYLMDESSVTNVYGCARIMSLAAKAKMPGINTIVLGDLPTLDDSGTRAPRNSIWGPRQCYILCTNSLYRFFLGPQITFFST